MYTDVKTVLLYQADPITGSNSKELLIRTPDGRLKRKLLTRLLLVNEVKDVSVTLFYELAEELARIFKNTDEAELEVISLMWAKDDATVQKIIALLSLMAMHVDIRICGDDASVVLKCVRQSRLYRVTMVRQLLLFRKDFLKNRNIVRKMLVFRHREALADALWRTLAEVHDLKEENKAAKTLTDKLEQDVKKLKAEKRDLEKGIAKLIEFA